MKTKTSKASGGARGSTREERRTEKRERILAAARAMLLEQGFEQLSPRALATRAGVSPAGMYEFFDARTPSWGRSGKRPVTRWPRPWLRLAARLTRPRIAWVPVDKLPGHVSDDVDLDGDGRPDVNVTFDLPAQAGDRLAGTLTPLGGLVAARGPLGGDAFDRLLVRLPDRVVVRVPLPASRRASCQRRRRRASSMASPKSGAR